MGVGGIVNFSFWSNGNEWRILQMNEFWKKCDGFAKEKAPIFREFITIFEKPLRDSLLSF